MGAKRSKYGNKRVRFDGYVFDSEAELKRYKELKLRARAGDIIMLQVHPRYFYVHRTFNNIAPGVKVFSYVADFVYYDKSMRQVIEDVKGVRTAEYRLKKKLIELEWNIKITEIEAYPHKRRKTNVRKKESRHARTQRRVQGDRATTGSAAADRLP